MELNRIEKAKPLTMIENQGLSFLEMAGIQVIPNVVYDIFSCGCVRVAGFGISVVHSDGKKRVSCPECREPILTKYKKCSTCGIDWVGITLRPSRSGACMSCYHKTHRPGLTGVGQGHNRSRNSVYHKSTAIRMVESAPRVTIYPPKKPKDIGCIHARICGESCFSEDGGDCSMFKKKQSVHLWS